MAGEKGQCYFTRLKQQLDLVLQGFRVHYHFFAEVPETEPALHDVGVAPAAFAFLDGIFSATREEEGPKTQQVSYVKNMDVKATLYHQMNADMVIATGSSFPLLAATVSPKVRWESHVDRRICT